MFSAPFLLNFQGFIMPKKTNKRNTRRAISDDVHAMDKIIDWDILFPRVGRPDSRKNQSSYIKKKLLFAREMLKEHNALKALVGEPSSFRPMKKSKLRDDAQKVLMVSPMFKGIFQPNPKNKVKVSRNARGEVVISHTTVAGFVLNLTADTFDPLQIKSPEHLRDVLNAKTPPKGALNVSLKTGDNRMMMTRIANFDDLVSEAALLWAKYADLAETDQARGGKRGAQKAAHPKQWLNGLWWS